MIYSLPTYPPAMRSHFYVDRFKNLIPHNLVFDLIFSHLLEQTHVMKNTMYNLIYSSPTNYIYNNLSDIFEKSIDILKANTRFKSV